MLIPWHAERLGPRCFSKDGQRLKLTPMQLVTLAVSCRIPKANGDPLAHAIPFYQCPIKKNDSEMHGVCGEGVAQCVGCFELQLAVTKQRMHQHAQCAECDSELDARHRMPPDFLKRISEPGYSM